MGNQSPVPPVIAQAEPKDRDSLEREHMWEMQTLAEQRAISIADKVYAKADRMYIDIPQVTGQDDDPHWVHGQYHDRWFLNRATVADLRAKIRAERDAKWKPWLIAATAIGGWIAALLKSLS
jgi:hypothetical protein